MSLASFSVHRPVLTVMAILIVIVLGGISLVRLPVDLMPDVTAPTISVSTRYENASPQEMEELVTRPIEQALSATPGATEVTSVSSEGSSNVRVSFAWGTDLDAASNDMRDRLDRVAGRLPDEADRPILRKFDLAAFPVLILGASSDLDPVQMRRILDDQVKYRLERVPGVASVDLWGGREREIHVDLDADKIKALNLSLDQVLARVKAGNVTLPAGTIDRGRYEVTIRTLGEYASLEELRSTVVALRDGSPVRLDHVADVSDSWQKVRRVVRVNGKPGVRLSVSKQSGTNTVEVASAVLEELRRVNRDMPHIQIVPIIDTSDYIQRSITSVGSSAIWGGALAVLILLVFLRSLSSTTIVALAIPISIVAAFALMYFNGMTLNIMTLGGLALGVGMLVDNSIVVLENVYRLREQGMGRREAAVQGAQEVTPAIIASTLTTVAVFLPIVFVRGMSGVMFRELAIVVAFSLICALFVAMTLVPMLASRMLRFQAASAYAGESLGHRIYRILGAGLVAMESSYKSLLHWALSHRLVVVGLCLAVLAASLGLLRKIGMELMPATDEGEVRVTAEMEVGTKLGLFDAKLKQVEEIIRQSVPEKASMVASSGSGPWRGGGSHTGDVRVALKPRSQRTRSSDQVAADLRRRLAGIPGLTVRVRSGEGMLSRLLTRGAASGERLSLEIRGYDMAAADALAQHVSRAVEDIDGVTDVRLSREAGAPEELVRIDRQKAQDLRLTVRQVAETLQTALGGTTAGYYRQGGNEYGIRVRLKAAETLSRDDVLDLTITNTDGQPVVLRNLVCLTPRTGPVSIERKNQERVVSVQANIADRDLGSILGDVRQRMAAVPKRADFELSYGAEYEEQQKAFRELLLSLVLALSLVYMVMACQYESLRDPLVVMFSVPMAAIGVLLTLFLTGTTLNIQSYIGCIMLGGIVVNNAILLVDTTNLLRRRDGLPVRQALEEAGRRRLRPILMTASTTILALLPLAVGLGEGGEAQAPLARAVIGGLTSAMLITLVFVPVIYRLFHRSEGARAPGG